jgi:glycogen operon protein
VTCHDGFTLQDLVSYNRKHNEANLENNRDGSDDNLSWNCGEEGPSRDKAVRALRKKQKRNFMATLLFSLGVPMISGGDELSRTQKGNNNAYCQDNELSWYTWDLDREGRAFLRFVRRVIAIRRSQPVFKRQNFFRGRSIHGSEFKDITWLKPDGREMTLKDWTEGSSCTLGVLLGGNAIDEVDDKGRPIVGETLLLFMNSSSIEQRWVLPAYSEDDSWELMLDTRFADGRPSGSEPLPSGAGYPLEAHSLALFRLLTEEDDT